MSSDLVRVLSIDGGGIRGIIPAIALGHVEELTGQPASRLFDVIVGTSTGGILALGLTVPGTGTRPAYGAPELAALYPTWGKRIFPSGGAPTTRERWLGRGEGFAERMGNASRRIGAPLGGSPRYGGNVRHSASGLEEALVTYFGSWTLSAALTEVMATSFDVSSGRPVVFSRSEARATGHDHAMVAVARATSAAPTFFPPQAIDLVRGGAPGQCIDGGVWANNPVILGYHRGLRLASDRGLPASHVVVVSLGTGAAAVEGGALAPSRTWLGSLTGLAANATDTHIQDFVMAYHHDGRGPRRYWRFQTFEAGAAGAMDDPTPERLDMLTRAAHALVESSRREFDAVADVLRR